MLPYLKELTQSQIDRGLITCVFAFDLEYITSADGRTVIRCCRGDENVADFRALLEKVKA